MLYGTEVSGSENQHTHKMNVSFVGRVDGCLKTREDRLRTEHLRLTKGWCQQMIN